MRMRRSFALPMMFGAVALVAGCGGGDGDGAAPVDSSDAAEPAPEPGDDASQPADPDDGAPEPVESDEGAAEPDESTTDVEPVGDDEPDAEPTTGPAPIDPATLEPGTALFVVDGNEYRFARGDSIFDVCEFEPDFDLGQAKMDLVDGPEDGSPHLQIGYGGDKQIVVLAVPPDIAYIAGKGEETDPYFQHFGVVPPTAGPIDVVGGGASGQMTMMKVLADELVDASFAVRCS